MSTNEIEERIGLQTQEIIKQQMGDLVLTCARLRAENEALREAVAAAERRGTSDGAQSADGPGREGSPV